MAAAAILKNRIIAMSHGFEVIALFQLDGTSKQN